MPTPDVGDTQDIHMGHQVPKPCGYGVRNKVDDCVVELNVKGSEMLSNPANSWPVMSSMGHNTTELNHVRVNADLHDGSTSNYEAF